MEQLINQNSHVITEHLLQYVLKKWIVDLGFQELHLVAVICYYCNKCSIIRTATKSHVFIVFVILVIIPACFKTIIMRIMCRVYAGEIFVIGKSYIKVWFLNSKLRIGHGI
jgi:hypothetical protein